MDRELKILILTGDDEAVSLVRGELTAAGRSLTHSKIADLNGLRTALGAGRWDIAISDFDHSGLSVFDAMSVVREEGIDLPFLILCWPACEEKALSALKAGARDFIHKSNTSRLIPAIERELKDRDDRKEKKNAQELMKNILESIGEGLVVIDRDYKIVTANRTYCEQVGDSRENIIGKHCYAVSHGLQRPCFEEGHECSVKDTLATGGHFKGIHLHRDGNGGSVYVEINAYPVKNPAGEVTSAIEIMTNITDRVRLEKDLKARLKELEEFYEMAVGRELRMKELREENDRLKASLKKSERCS